MYEIDWPNSSQPLSCDCLVQSYNAKISDFGLAKLGPSGGDSHVTTRIMGTYGYAAPEYIATGDIEIFANTKWHCHYFRLMKSDDSLLDIISC